MAGRADVMAGKAFVMLYLKNNLTKPLVSALRSGENAFRSLGQTATAIGQTVGAAGLAMATPIALAVKRFADFDDTIRSVAGVTQASGEQLASLTAKAKELGATTSYTAVQVGLLMTELGRAGFNPEQVNEMTGAVLNLARATGTEAALASGIMAASIRQFGLAAADATRVADVLTAGANKSFNTVESLGEALSYAGPVAADFNMSIEDTVALLGTLGNVGIQGSNAGTALRRMLTLTGAEAEKLQGIFGVSFVDTAGNARPLVDALDDVAKMTSGLGTAERSKKFNEAFGLLGITGASAIAKNITGTRALREELQKAGGTAKKTADMMDSGLGGSFRIALSAVEGLAIQLGEVLEPTISRITKQLTTATTGMIEFVKANQGLVVAITGGVAAMVGVGGALIGIGAAANFAAWTLGGLATVAGVLLSPVGLITAALVAGGVAWVQYTESGKAAMAGFLAAVLPIVETLKAAFGGIVTAIKAGNWQAAMDIAFAGLHVAAAKGLDVLRSLIGDTLGNVAGQFLSGDFAGAWGSAVDGMALIWESFARGVVDTFTGAAEAVIGAWLKATTFITDAIFKLASQEGPIGDAMAKVLGVDLRKMQEGNDNRAAEAKRQSILLMQDQLDVEQGKAPGERDYQKINDLNQRLQTARDEFGAGNYGAAQAGDVFGDARKAASDILTQQVAGARAGLAQARSDATARQTEAAGRFVSGQTAAASGLDAAAKAAEDRLAALLQQQQTDAYAADFASAMEGTAAAPGVAATPGAPGSPMATATAATPRGIGSNLTTYNASAAQAAGFMGGQSPEKEMATNIYDMRKTLEELGLLAAKQSASNEQVVAMHERFLAAFQYG